MFSAFSMKKKFEMIVLGFPRANATRADSISFAHTLALPNVYSRVSVIKAVDLKFGDHQPIYFVRPFKMISNIDLDNCTREPIEIKLKV